MPRREFRGGAETLSLASPLAAGATTFTTTTPSSGWPTGTPGPFVVRIGAEGAPDSEKVLVQSRSGATFAVAQRGYDGTADVDHAAGSEVVHVWDATSAQNVHDHANDTARDDHTQYIRTDGTRGFTGVTQIAGTPGTSRPGDSSSAGSSNLLARADHVHGREPYGTSPAALAMDQQADAGVSLALAREDHRHAMPGWAGTGGLFGTATTPARSDHSHPASETLLSRYKPADQLTTGTTAVDDTDLVIPVGANEVWAIQFVLFISTGVSFTLLLNVVGPTGATGTWGVPAFDSGGSVQPPKIQALGTELPSGINGTPALVVPAVVFVGATAGNVVVRYRRSTAGTPGVGLLKGSFAWARKLA
jgi:hypothetical protein